MVKMKQKYTKKTIKYIDSLLGKTLFKLRYKINSFFKKFIEYFDLPLQKILLKLKNKIINFSKKKSDVSNFNKLLITSIALLFFYLFYLSIPSLYNKTWLQNNLENKLLEEFKINFSISHDISYNILPSPHFLIKNSKIFRMNGLKPIALSEIKNLKVFISQKNLFNKDKIFIKKLIINKANFSLKKDDMIFLNNVGNKKFSNKEIRITHSNIFLKDELDEVITIIKASKVLLFYDQLKFSNLLTLKGETFKIPFNFDFEKKVYTSESKRINIESKKLKLNILNKSVKNSEQSIIGQNIISILNSNFYTQYNIEKDLITFESDNSRTNSSNLYYKGKLSFTPFDLKMYTKLENFKLSKLINNDSTIIELIKNKLLFNENISADLSFDIGSISNEQFFNSAKINFSVFNGKININQSKFVNKKIGFIEIDNSNFFFKKDQLILNSDIMLNIKNPEDLFSFLGTPKKSRKLIKNIFFNLDYNLLDNKVFFNTVKIDGLDADKEILRILDDLGDMNNNLNNSRRLINSLLSIYAG